MQDFTIFKTKNLLNLYVLDKHDYWEYAYNSLKSYFNKSYRFNFIDYSRKHGIKKTEEYIRNFIKENNIDVVLPFFFASDFELTPEFYHSLRSLAKVVFCFFDDDSFFDSITRFYAQSADVVITTDYFHTFAYRRYGVQSIYYLPIQGKNTFHPMNARKDIDVCFVGDCTKSDRRKYLDFLAANGIKAETFGFGSKNGYVPLNELSNIFSRSKIVLTFTRVDDLTWMTEDEPLLRRVRQNKGHYSKAALTKSFCLSEYAPSLPYIAEIGEEIEVFHNEQELLEKVVYYLKNEDERERIAAKAYKRALDLFEGESAFPKLLTELANCLAVSQIHNFSTKDIYLSENFRSKAVNGLAFSLCIMLSAGKIRNAAEMFFRLFRYGLSAFLKGFPRGVFRAFMVYYHEKTNKYSEIYKR